MYVCCLSELDSSRSRKNAEGFGQRPARHIKRGSNRCSKKHPRAYLNQSTFFHLNPRQHHHNKITIPHCKTPHNAIFPTPQNATHPPPHRPLHHFRLPPLRPSLRHPPCLDAAFPRHHGPLGPPPPLPPFNHPSRLHLRQRRHRCLHGVHPPQVRRLGRQRHRFRFGAGP